MAAGAVHAVRALMGVVAGMAGDAGGRDSGPVTVDVALLAGNLAVDMPLVVEKNMFGNVVYLDPGGGRAGVEIIVLFLDPGEFHDDVVVAVKAFLHRRDPGEGGVSHVRVAELTLDFLDPGVHVVAEGDRLPRADLLRLHIIEIKEGGGEQGATRGDE